MLPKHQKTICAGLLCLTAPLTGTPRMRVASIPLTNPYPKDRPEKVRIFGLLRLDTAWTSCQGLGFIENALWLYPATYYYDHNGCDINTSSQFLLTPANCMLGADIGTFSIGRADITGRVFGGFSGLGPGTAGLFAIGQAYAQIDWPKTRLVVGSDFHPFTSKVTTPNVVAINAGAPFSPLVDAPQIRLTQKFGRFSLSPTIWTEFVFASDGPQSISTAYIFNSGLPAFNLMLEYESDRAAWGIGIDVKKLRPHLNVTQASGNKYVNPATITSFVSSTYVNLQFERFAALAQMCGGQNGTDLLLPGGYGISCRSSTTGQVGYTNTYFLSVWSEIDIKTNNPFKPGFFVGYSKNFGTRHKKLDVLAVGGPCGQPDVYSLDRFTGLDLLTGIVHEDVLRRVDRAMRFDAYVRYILKPVELGLEFEATRAVFGLYNKKAQVVHQYAQTYAQLMAVASCYF